MSISFLTLLLGLIAGPQPVELSVNGPVAAVELLLDGASLGRIAGPPWKATVDFGRELAPHELTARALDQDGNEVAVARQWVNLPRPKAEVEISLEGGSQGAPAAARLTWLILTGEKPSRFVVTFDGQPLAVDDDGRVALPPYDPDSPHILTAEVLFPSLAIAHKDAVFGGRFGSAVSTELTAVPVRLRKGAKMPPAESLQGWFTAGGRPVAVAAVEEGPGQLLVVRAPDPRETWAQLGTQGGQPQNGVSRYEMRLGKEDSTRFVFPIPRQFRAGDTQSDLFDISTSYTAEIGGLPWMILRLADASQRREGKRVTDAVAVAGLHAMAENRRRAVLLILGSDASDASVFTPAVVRRYLSLLRVPLFVWTLRDPGKTPAASAWGTGMEVANFRQLSRAVRELQESLESQHIVWLEGLHLPQAVALTPAAGPVLELLPGGND